MSMVCFVGASSAGFAIGLVVGALAQWRHVRRYFHLKPKFWTPPLRRAKS